MWLRRRIGPTLPKPEIVCYYFNRRDFHELAETLHVDLTISDIHHLNPYRGFRFNAVYQKAPR